MYGKDSLRVIWGYFFVSTPGVEPRLGPPVPIVEAWEGLLSYHANRLKHSVDIAVAVDSDGFRPTDFLPLHLPIKRQAATP